MKILIFSLALVSAALLSGCSTYTTPAAGVANLSAISSSSMRESFSAEPAAQFPASIAAVRVQAPRYQNYYTRNEGGVYGSGRYSIVTVKEVEDQADIQRIASLPHVAGLATISTLLLPAQLESDKELREAAARLKADMLLLYTFNTSFHKNDKSTALNAITLGLSPTRRIFVRVTASALLIDTRTGFIYAAQEANEKRELTTNAWESNETADRARRIAEKAAFKTLVSEFEKNWPQVIERAKKGA
jgi:hypothetical protein